MNRIDTQVTTSDRINARRKSPAMLAKGILEKLQNGVPYSTTFLHDIPTEAKEQVEKELKMRFELWANSWVAPACREIIAKSEAKRPGKRVVDIF